MTPLESLREHLLRKVFARALMDDAQLIAAVQAFGGEIQFVRGEMQFTLPRLFEFVRSDFERTRLDKSDLAAATEYPAFHRMLYQSQVNAELRGLGGIVVVERADDDHARSLYRLTRVPA